MAFRNIDLGGSDAQVYQEWFHTAVPNLLQFEWNPFVFQREIQDEWGFGWLFTLLASITKTIVPTYEFFQVVYVTLSFGILILIIEDMQLKQQEKGLFLFADNLIIICIQGANRDNSHCPFFWTPTAL